MNVDKYQFSRFSLMENQACNKLAVMFSASLGQASLSFCWALPVLAMPLSVQLPLRSGPNFMALLIAELCAFNHHSPLTAQDPC